MASEVKIEICLWEYLVMGLFKVNGTYIVEDVFSGISSL